ncbi:formimidoylglutamate deiminase [Demetria terragena]|uniref:formimidoylglutamate deiminase n=1 Tax=Demetria terragena TaxID=63959 RepID=UPI00037B76AD|nr:formimidoylglutamate deiminase [Demetria terragena]
MSVYWAENAFLPAGLAHNVRFEIDKSRFVTITPDVPQDEAYKLPGVVLPGLANCHSHAFHRALRGRTHHGGGTFWTWREQMYAIAGRLDPDTYLTLARAVYAEMALAGITSVGEFHYLHHAPGGGQYADPNDMGEALRQAARDAGVRLTLLDTCYLAGGLNADGHLPLVGVQERFGDRDAHAWSTRVSRLREDDQFRVGAAVHSVRAVPREHLATIREAAAGRPLHAHVSEQPGENDACHAFYGLSPTALFHEAGMVDDQFSAVHATHLSDADVRALGSVRATACFCPTTERDLADGIGPARGLLDAGAQLSLGSDQHAVIDILEEARALEMHERLNTLQRGRIQPDELLSAATAHGTIGWPEVGRLAVAQRADLVAVRLDTVRTAGVDPAQIVLAASAGDIDTVIRDGEVVVSGGEHRLGDVGRMLNDAITPLWTEN